MDSLKSDELAGMIRNSPSTVALSGAGISTAAGIPDFRSPEGMYNSGKYNPDTVFDIHAFDADPSEFYAFTRDLLAVVKTLTPTFTHRFLAELEGKKLLDAVITQNIDPLHFEAGSKNVLSIHGNYHTSHCRQCGKEFSLKQLLELLDSMAIPTCGCGGVIKPDVVFFGEAVMNMDRCTRVVEQSELLLVLGSSLVVYPAAALPNLAKGDVVVVNKSSVALAQNERTYFVQADLDEYFQQVAAALQP